MAGGNKDAPEGKQLAVSPTFPSDLPKENKEKLDGRE